MEKRKQKGITLIALAITIIVLIILALIGLGTIFGDGGILKSSEASMGVQANSAKRDEELANAYVADTQNSGSKKELRLAVSQKVTSNPLTEGKYGKGEQITYEVTIENTGKIDLVDVKVRDTLERPDGTTTVPGNSGEEIKTIPELGVGEQETYNITHTVTEEDLGGTLNNKIVAQGTSAENPGDTVERESNSQVETKENEANLDIRKEILNKPKRGYYKEGEEIQYRIYLTNTGNVKIESFKITDTVTTKGEGAYYEFTKLTYPEGQEYIDVGQTGYIDYTYTVKKEDIGKKITNSATIAATVPPVPKGEKEPEVEVPTEPEEEINPHLTVTKVATTKPANGTAYALGETIKYQITVTNDGNLTITNVVVTDELTGDQWTVESLEPGASKTFETEYEVTQVDILAGSVVNVATATGTSPDPDEPDVPVDPGENEVPTGPKNGHLTVAKDTTSRPANGDTYVVGETIKYEITVINDGNLTITDILVEDELTGNTGEKGWTIESLAPGESQTFEAKYVVTQEDILAGSVVNVAIATGTSPDPNKPDVPVDPGEIEVPTEPKKRTLNNKQSYNK